MAAGSRKEGFESYSQCSSSPEGKPVADFRAASWMFRSLVFQLAEFLSLAWKLAHLHERQGAKAGSECLPCESALALSGSRSALAGQQG